MPSARDDLTRPWKVPIGATLAGKIEFMLTDPLLKKPIYGTRTKLIEALLEWWVAREEGRPESHVPTLSQLRSGDS